MSTLYEAVAQHRASNRTAIRFGSRSISFRELTRNIDRMISYLQKQGISSGSVVTLVLPNIPLAIYAFYAANAIGAVCNILHPLTTAETIVSIMKQVKSSVAFILLSRYRDDREQFDRCNFRFFTVNPVYDASPLMRFGFSAKYRIFPRSPNAFPADRFRRCPPAHSFLRRNAREDSVYLHSGGTTGVPKTIVLSDYAINNLAGKASFAMGGDLTEKSVLAALPMFHGFGLAVGIHTPLSQGASCVLMLKFDVKHTLRLIDSGKLNVLLGIPLLYQKLMKHPDFPSTNFCSLNFCFIGGDNVPPSLIGEFNSFMLDHGSDCKLLEGYGLTETVSVCCVNTKEQFRSGSVGKPLPGISVCIRDDDGRLLPSAAVGEVCVSGDTLMNRYLNDPQATAQTMRRSGGHIYVRTGDLGYLDADGFLHLKGRKKRVFKISGINVYPSELEQLACMISGVLNASLEFFSDPTPHTVLYLIKEATAEPDSIRQQIHNLLHSNSLPYCYPRDVVFLEKFPETALGKIDHSKFQDIKNREGTQ